MDGACGMYGRAEKYLEGFDEKIEEKTPLGRSRCRWEDNIKMELQAVGMEVMGWICPVQDRDGWQDFVNATMNFGVP